MKIFSLILIFILPFAMIQAKDITTKSGKTYKSYTVAGTSAEGLTILHSTGGVLIPLEEWPENRRNEVKSYISKVENRRKFIAGRPDLTTKTGVLYKKYQILGFNSSGARVSHWAGITIVPIKDLPDDIQKKFEAKITAATKPKGILLENSTEKRPESPFPADMQRAEKRGKKTADTSSGIAVNAKAGDTEISFGSSKNTKKGKEKTTKKRDKDKDKDKNKDKNKEE